MDLYEGGVSQGIMAASDDSALAVFEENSSDNSDFEGFLAEDLADNIPNVPDSDPDLSDIEVSSVESGDISDVGETEDENDNVDLGEVQDGNAIDIGQNSTWTTNFSDIVVDTFEQVSGPNLPAGFDTATARPLDFFELLFKPEMFEEIVTHTNNYALFKRDEIRARKNSPGYLDAKWSDTSVAEIRALFGINVIMGITNLPQYHFYWHHDKFVGNVGIKDTMTRLRYEKLTQYLHVSDRANEPDHNDGYDRLYKIRPIITMTQQYYNPGKNQTVDEAMIAYKGRLSYIQYLPAKPIKRGIKVWVRCDSESAYLHEYDVYLGKQRNSEHGLAYDIVTKLCQSIAGHNHHLYCDNYFSSMPLSKNCYE